MVGSRLLEMGEVKGEVEKSSGRAKVGGAGNPRVGLI